VDLKAVSAFAMELPDSNDEPRICFPLSACRYPFAGREHLNRRFAIPFHSASAKRAVASFPAFRSKKWSGFEFVEASDPQIEVFWDWSNDLLDINSHFALTP
jgi:hypothetical protein